MYRRHFVAGAAAATLAPFAVASTGKTQTLHQDGPEWFTDVAVTAHDGRTFRFYDDLLKGKIILVKFFYTGCDALCPLMMENLARVQDILSPRVGKDIFMYSISLQPEFDTRRCWPPAPGATASDLDGCCSPASLTTSNCSATAWALSIPIRSRTQTWRPYRHRAYRQRADASLDHESRLAQSERYRSYRETGDPGARLTLVAISYPRWKPRWSEPKWWWMWGSKPPKKPRDTAGPYQGL